MKNKKNNLLKYYIKKKKLSFIIKKLNILKYFNKKLDIKIINNLILNQNNIKNINIKIYNILNILKNKKKSSKSYNLLIKFKKYWKKINKKFILDKYIDTETIFLWLAYVLNELLYVDLKKQTINYKLKENNLYIKLSEIIKINVDNILNNLDTTISKSLINKINNKKIYYIIVNRIIKTCFKARILYKKKIYMYKKNVNYIILNKKIFKKIISVIISQSIILPTLIPIEYKIKDNININNNNNYTFNYNLNYINSQ